MTDLQKVLIPYKYENKQRIGANGDGGYVASMDHLPNSLISLGCCNNTSFEEGYISLLDGDYEVNIYDGEGDCNLAFFDKDVHFHNRHVYSLDDIDLEKESFLQCDIEGAEFDIFSGNIEKIKLFSQICLEVHFTYTGTIEGWISLFKKINETHSLIHIHGNNCVPRLIEGVPEVVELTYIRTKDLKEVSDQECPDPNLDKPNNPSFAELDFCWWK